jgi:hypothetical protein
MEAKFDKQGILEGTLCRVSSSQNFLIFFLEIKLCVRLWGLLWANTLSSVYWVEKQAVKMEGTSHV